MMGPKDCVLCKIFVRQGKSLLLNALRQLPRRIRIIMNELAHQETRSKLFSTF